MGAVAVLEVFEETLPLDDEELERHRRWLVESYGVEDEWGEV